MHLLFASQVPTKDLQRPILEENKIDLNGLGLRIFFGPGFFMVQFFRPSRAFFQVGFMFFKLNLRLHLRVLDNLVNLVVHKIWTMFDIPPKFLLSVTLVTFDFVY